MRMVVRRGIASARRMASGPPHSSRLWRSVTCTGAIQAEVRNVECDRLVVTLRQKPAA